MKEEDTGFLELSLQKILVNLYEEISSELQEYQHIMAYSID